MSRTNKTRIQPKIVYITNKKGKHEDSNPVNSIKNYTKKKEIEKRGEKNNLLLVFLYQHVYARIRRSKHLDTLLNLRKHTYVLILPSNQTHIRSKQIFVQFGAAGTRHHVKMICGLQCCNKLWKKKRTA